MTGGQKERTRVREQRQNFASFSELVVIFFLKGLVILIIIIVSVSIVASWNLLARAVKLIDVSEASHSVIVFITRAQGLDLGQ